MNTPRSIKETSITIGFVQVPVCLYKADQNTDLDFRSLCGCGKPPRQLIVCENPECGTTVKDDGNDAAYADPVIKSAIANGSVVRRGLTNGEDVLFVAKRYGSWQETPKKGYEWARGQFVELTSQEMKEARGKEKHDTFEVSKTVDFKSLATGYVLSEPVYLLPPDGANKVTKKAFALITESLDQQGMALLALLTLRDRTYRYAIVADKTKNVMMAYKIEDRRDLPYSPEKEEVTTAEAAQVKGILQGMYSQDATLAAPPDPLMEMLEVRIAATEKLPGIGQSVLIPKE